MTIGLPFNRPDAPIKLTGHAMYAGDRDVPGQLHAVLVTASIAKGRIRAIDRRAALKVPDVTHVLIASDLPKLAAPPSPPLASNFIPMQGDEIRYEGQAIAVVLAESLRAAEHAAGLIEVSYSETDPAIPAEGTEAALSKAVSPNPKSGYMMGPPQSQRGSVDPALSTAPITIEATYVQPARHHNPMEPSATLAWWDDDTLTTYDTVQHGYAAQMVLAAAFALKPENVRVLSPHTGGGYGSKSYIWPHQLLVAAAAKVAGRPVKLTLTRAQFYAGTGYQPRIVHRMKGACDKDGRLLALQHDALNATGASDDYVEFVTGAAKALYACPAVKVSQSVERVNFNVPTYMRAPAEGAGTFPLGCLMDELAHAAKIDPLDFRLINYAEHNPDDGRPWSSKKLREAYEEGARLFGWRDRKRRPARDGQWRIGHGMASCTMGSALFPSKARIVLKSDGTAILESGFHDIGAGSLTVFPQIAAEYLGLDPAMIDVRHGDTRLAPAGPAFGSSSTASLGAAIVKAAEAIRDQLAQIAGVNADTAALRGGRLIARESNEGFLIEELLAKAGMKEITGDGELALPGGAPINIDGMGTPFASRTFGAIFVEVGVDPELGLLRLRRAVGSYSAGRIVNPRTARSQMIGGIIWGWGMAAMEQSVAEPKLGRWLSKNLSGVAIPVNADIPAGIEIHFVDEFDAHASPFGAKGIGELGATGVAAAVANAVFDAIGKRIRTLPLTPEKIVSAANEAA